MTTMTEREAQRAGLGKAGLFTCCNCGRLASKKLCECLHLRCANCKSSKPRKYGNKPCEMDGIKFDSQAEMKRYSELKLLERAGKIWGLEAAKAKLRFHLDVDGILICVYEADASYYMRGKDGKPQLVVEDTKGVRTPAYKIKRKLMKVLLGIEIQEIG